MQATEELPAFIQRREWSTSFKSYTIVDCSIRDKDLLHMVACKTESLRLIGDIDPSEVPLRSIQVCLDESEPSHRASHNGLLGFPYPIAGSAQKPIAQDLVAGMNGHVYSGGSGHEGMEEPRDHENNGVVPTRVKQIGGYAFIVGTSRDVVKRTALGQWVPLNREGIPPTHRVFPDGALGSSEYTSAVGFNDLDGPNESLLYAVGGKGDVWRYDGHRWTQCDFPSNEQLNTVTVAPDGTVYISGEGGNLWIGAEDSWRLAARGESSVLFNDSVWFQDQLWLCSDYQLRVWDGESLVRPRHRGEEVAYTGHMDARDGLLLIAAGSYAHCFDGTEWRCLVAPYK